MEIRKLDPEQYAGYPLSLCYTTGGYYAIEPCESGFAIAYRRFDRPVEKTLEDSLFSQWLDEPVAYGAFEQDRLLGYAEGFWEKWNNRFRISNIGVFEPSNRHRGTGTLLMNAILSHARQTPARMAVLETQTCNEKAIAFYQKNGFSIIGFDLFAYTNSDPRRHEIRLEMGLFLREETNE